MINNTQLMGRLGADVEVKAMPNGGKVANFSLALTDKYTNKQGEKVERTDWIRCVLFGDRADILAAYTKVGDRLHVSGALRTGNYFKEGVQVPTVEVRVSEFTFVESAKAKTAA